LRFGRVIELGMSEGCGIGHGRAIGPGAAASAALARLVRRGESEVALDSSVSTDDPRQLHCCSAYRLCWLLSWFTLGCH